VSRMVSFIILLAILLGVTAVFVLVMANFLIPLFLAVLLAIIFGPLHQRVLEQCRGRVRLAAALTSAAILLIVLLPLSVIVWQAAREGELLYNRLAGSDEDVSATETETPGVRGQAEARDAPGQAVPPEELEPPPNSDETQTPDADEDGTVFDVNEVAAKLAEWGSQVGLDLDQADVRRTLIEKAQTWLAPAAWGAAAYVGYTLLALGVMIVAPSYFLADGPEMVRAIMRLSPLDDRYEEQLIARFADLTRAMVVATLASAVVQGLLLGVGLFFAGVHAVFLLMLLAMLLAMVPFIGTAAVWVPVCLWLGFQDGRITAAVVLAIYCAGIVSMADNVIKPLVLHGRANLHPLLALLSVLGGVQALGPIGIFVGPMAVAFLQTLLNMVHVELESMDRDSKKGAEAAETS